MAIVPKQAPLVIFKTIQNHTLKLAKELHQCDVRNYKGNVVKAEISKIK